MSSRRQEILEVAGRLFAQRGFHEVGIDDIGAELGISGPALYHHFKSKEAILAELLIGISELLLAEGRRRAQQAAGPAAAIESLIEWHTQFALENRDLITIQSRDLTSVAPPLQERVRMLQRRYVQLWASAIAEDRGVAPVTARAVAHAAFGLLNSTPHSSKLPARTMAPLLRSMCAGAVAAASDSEVDNPPVRR